jgi:hypothetical protein
MREGLGLSELSLGVALSSIALGALMAMPIADKLACYCWRR